MKLSRKTKTGSHPVVWRPDFREVGSLPDTKAVRTGFLVNFTPMLLLSGLLMIFAYNEYALRVAQGALAKVEAEVDAGVSGNRAILFKGGEFRKLGRGAEEVVMFKDVPLDVALFLRDLPAQVPEPMTLLRVEVDQLPKEAGAVAVLVLTGTILPDTPSGPSVLLERFQRDFAESGLFSRWALASEIQAFGRNNTTGNFDFSVRFELTISKGDEE